MKELEKNLEQPTGKTKEELLTSSEDELTSYERMLRSMLSRYPELTLEEAIEFANSLP